jgi:uncharacterized LabA/DUF88 family protein
MPASRGKTICFIDNSNIFGGQQASGWRIDWARFQQYLEQNGQVWQVHLFASEQDPPRAIQTNFYRFLKDQLHWEIHLYELGRKSHTCSRCDNNDVTSAEKGVDVGLATKMMVLGVNKAYETAILVAGDRDYLETVKFVKNLGLRVEIISWKGALAPALESESSSSVVLLDSLRGQIEKV